MTVRAAVYCRMSVADFDDTEKVDRQEADCRTVCDRRGWDVSRVFIDNNRSAWQRSRKRPGWDAMLEGVRDGRFDAIVVYHGDRLIRQPYDLEMLLNLAAERGIRLASPSGTRNLDSADDRFILRVEAAQACRESDNISRRTRRAIEARRDRGLIATGGHRSFGRDRDGTIIEAEAALIRDAYARLLAGESQTSLWKAWVRTEVPTVRGGPWYPLVFRSMLRRPDIAALVVHDGRVVGEASNVLPIVERDTWEAVQAVLTAASKPGSGDSSSPRKHLLSGIARCSSCNTPLAAKPVAKDSMTYLCPSPACPRGVTRKLVFLDRYVVEYVLARLEDPRLWERLEARRREAAAGSESAAGELEALEARRIQLVAELADDDAMDPALFRRMLSRLDERVAAARARAGANRAGAVLEGLRGLDWAGWDALPLDRRRAVVRELVTVTVLPSQRGPKKFNPELVRVEDVEI